MPLNCSRGWKNAMIDLTPEQMETVRSILMAQVPGVEVRVFGSRVLGTAREHADLDLALVSGKPLEWREIEALKDAFADSDLPFMVDILDWNTLSESFRSAIESCYELAQKPGLPAD